MRLRTNKGFSLVELMIVVAIIGILAAVAIPNFMRFQAKARQAEARADLSAIYTAEKAFTAEWQTFLSDLHEIGYVPEGTFRYQHGFNNAGVNYPGNYSNAALAGAAVAVARTHTGGCGTPTAPLALFAATNPNQLCGIVLPPAGGALGAVPAGALANATFMANALGDIDDDATRDVWQISQAKQMFGPCTAAAAAGCAANGGDLDN